MATPFFLTPQASQLDFPQPLGQVDLRHDERQHQVQAAWDLVTSKLCLPSCIPVPEVPGTSPPEFQLGLRDEETDFHSAFHLILQTAKKERGGFHGTYDILAWHSQQVQIHLIKYGSTALSALPRARVLTGEYNGHLEVVENAVRILEAALTLYASRLSVILQAMGQNGYPIDAAEASDGLVPKLKRDLHALIASLSAPVVPSLRVILQAFVKRTLQIPKAGDGHRTHHKALGSDDAQNEHERGQLLHLVEVLNQVGLAGEQFEVLFAEVMDREMSEYIFASYARVWKTPPKRPSSFGLGGDTSKPGSHGQPSWCIFSLCDWIGNHFARLALEVLSRVDRPSADSKLVSLADVQQWKDIGIERLATLRISELFDIVLQWPASKGALDDLKASVTTPSQRFALTSSFSIALQKRLLHPGRSTLDILRVYISMIRTFHALDHSKVLLSRVVPSLQLYLVQRDDAVRMVVTGLLASSEEIEKAQKATSSPTDMEPDGRGNGKLVELAVLLNDPEQQRRMDVDDDDLDWDDMDWVPDPVDAGVNYKRPKSEDVIGTLISTLGSEDVFIKEFQNTIADNLLSTQTDFAQEQKVLDLLKRRFGEVALQNCEVMIKDIFDSRKVDTHIRRVGLGLPANPPRTFGTPIAPPVLMDLSKQLDVDEQKQGQVPYHARILSRLYWPNIVQETFSLPQPVAQQQMQYESGYERLKSARKLTWLHQLGQAKVELELEDRTVDVDCKTFEAAVIYAFQDDEDRNSDGAPARRTLQELQEHLEMDEELVLQAIDFWESQGVLARYSSAPDIYAVVERKDAPPTRPELHPSASAPAALEGEHDMPGMPPKPAGVKRAGTTSAMDAKENERRAMYWQFIVGMLTNSMPTMPLGQMAAMMRMLIADKFPWSDQELQEFLAEKVELGELEIAGGKYKLVKK